MRITAADTFAQQVALTAVASLVTAVVGTLIIGGFLARIARRAQARREDRQIRDKLIDDITHTLGAAHIKLQSYEQFVSRPIDGVHRFSDEIRARRDELDETYEAAAVEATALEARLRAYFEDVSVSLDWHSAWDCLAIRYFSLIVAEEGEIAAIYERHALDPARPESPHTGLTPVQLRDPDLVIGRYRECRSSATAKVATLPMRHGADRRSWSRFR